MKTKRFPLLGSLLSIAITGVSVLPGSSALAQIIPDVSLENASYIETINNLNIILSSTLAENHLFSNLSQLDVANATNNYFANAGSLTINPSQLVITDEVRISNGSINLTSVNNSGNILLNSNNLILTGGGNISANPTDLVPVGSGGNISITTSLILVKPQPVPEPTFTFSMLMTAGYAAWQLKRNHKRRTT